MVWSLSTGPSMDPTRLEFGFKISSKKFPSSSINFWINSFGSFLFLNRLQQQQNQKHSSIHPVNDHCRQHFANEPSKMLNYSVSLNQNSVTESQSPAESHVLYSKNAFLLNIWGTNVPVDMAIYGFLYHAPPPYRVETVYFLEALWKDSSNIDHYNIELLEAYLKIFHPLHSEVYPLFLGSNPWRAGK